MPVPVIEPAVGGSGTEGTQLLDLAFGQAPHGGQVREPVRGGESVHHAVPDGEGHAVLLGDAGTDRGGLPHRETMADDRPRRGLVGTGEEHRTQPRVEPMEPSDDLVAGGDVGEARAVNVEGQDPLKLDAHFVGRRPAGVS